MSTVTPTAPAETTGYVYDEQFLSYVQRISAHSAKRISQFLLGSLDIESVLDVGCAQGTWLHWWNQHGVEDFLGVDGDYVVRERLEIPSDRFVSEDVSMPFDLERKFDLVQCLEVAEHIVADCAATLVDNLTKHSDLVLFSAAPPGQGGEYHVNEQPYDYWRAIFKERGYVALDAVRPELSGDANVAVWYRHNVVLYVHEQRLATMPQEFRDTLVPDDEMIADISPVLYRIRKAMVRCLPSSTQLSLAKLLARLRG